jgi:hypothetical protein
MALIDDVEVYRLQGICQTRADFRDAVRVHGSTSLKGLTTTLL